MNVEAHLAAGWVLAHLGGAETRRFRQVVTAAAIAPDLDGLSYLFGPTAYSNWHHVAGHNIFFSFWCSVVCVMLCRRWSLKVLLFTQLAFYSHFFGDYYFTRCPIEYLWPVSHKLFLHGYSIGLDHPINLFLSYFSFVIFVVFGFFFHRTPIELVSPELDRRIINLFRRRPLACGVCGRGANERCSVCDQPVCMRDARLTRRFAVRCAKCHGTAKSVELSPASP